MEATFSPSRNRVSTSSSEGNTEKSSGFLTYMLVSSTTRDSAMFVTISTSSNGAGSGTTSSSTTPTTPIGTASWVRLVPFIADPFSCYQAGSGRCHAATASSFDGPPGGRWMPWAEPRRRRAMTKASTRATAMYRWAGIS